MEDFSGWNLSGQGGSRITGQFRRLQSKKKVKVTSGGGKKRNEPERRELAKGERRARGRMI